MFWLNAKKTIFLIQSNRNKHEIVFTELRSDNQTELAVINTYFHYLMIQMSESRLWETYFIRSPTSHTECHLC